VFVLFVIYAMYGVEEHFPNKHLSILYPYCGYFLCFVSLIVFYISCKTNPGTITKKNQNTLLDKYQFDNVYYEKKDCRTCKTIK
jgi:hypothetical protein